MSLEPRHMVALACEGCGQRFHDGELFTSGNQARAVAYGDGWQFVHKVTALGRVSSQTSDVCPTCVPKFQPTKDNSHAGGTS